MVPVRLVSACLISLLLLAVAARADLEVELPRGGTVMATLSDPAHEDRWRLLIPGDSVLSITVRGIKPKGGERPGLALRLLDAEDKEIAVGTSNSAGAKMKKIEIPTSGFYVAKVTLTGSITGDYTIVAKWKAPKKTKSTPALTGAEVEIPFVTDTGGTATFTLKGKKGVTPTLVRVESADGSFSYEFTPPEAGATKHIMKNVILGVGGDYVLTVAGTGGEAKALVKVKAPKSPKGVFEITDEVVDPDDGYIRGSLIGPDGGRVEVTDDDAGLEGSAVEVPKGALAIHVPVLVSTAVDIEPANEDEIAAGPTVGFGPPGLTFAVDSEIEIPFDPTPFKGDFSEMRIVQREKDGTETVVPPASVTIDEVNGIAKFPVKHFTSFRAFAPKGRGSNPPPLAFFYEDFENGWGGWWASNGIWEIGEPTFVDGPTALFGSNVAGMVLDDKYPEDRNTDFVTPSFTLPTIEEDEEIQFRFWHWYGIDYYDTIWPVAEEQLSPGVWGNPTTFDSYLKYSGVWTQGMVDLSALAGKKIRMRFTISQSNSGFPDKIRGVGPGWYLDEISATVRQCVDMSDGQPVTWDFEEGWGDWFSIGAQWEVGEPTSGPEAAYGGTKCAGMVLGENYWPESEGILVSPSVKLPVLDLGEELHLRFWHWFSVDRYDTIRVYIFEELGSGARSAWTQLVSYTRDSDTWFRPLIDLSAYGGKKVRLAFKLSQGTSGFPDKIRGEGPGWFIDDVQLEIQ